MNPEKLNIFLTDVENSEPVIAFVKKLSKEFEISEPTIKATLKMAIMVINGISKK